MATSRPVPQISAGGAGAADAPRLAGQRARAGKRRGARAGGGPRAGDPAGRFFLPVPGRRRPRAARRWRTWSARTSSASCAKRSTTCRARRAFWISTAPRCTTSCGATVAVKPIHLILLGHRQVRGRIDAGAPGRGAGAHLPHALPHPAGDARRGFRARPPARPVLLDRHSAAIWSALADPDARVLAVTAATCMFRC